MPSIQNNNSYAYDNDTAVQPQTGQYNNTGLCNTGTISEEQWLKNIFLISDMQTWLHELELRLICQLPVKNKKKLLRKTYYLTAAALAHILERHYYCHQRCRRQNHYSLPGHLINPRGLAH